MKASKNKLTDTNNDNQNTSSTNKNNDERSINGPLNKKQRILEKITYDDLEEKDTTEHNVGQQLNLSKVSISTKIVLLLYFNFLFYNITRWKGTSMVLCQIQQLKILI